MKHRFEKNKKYEFKWVSKYDFKYRKYILKFISLYERTCHGGGDITAYLFEDANNLKNIFYDLSLFKIKKIK